jgi:dihydrofolate synthase/folylpolyglutamate synthase
LFSKTFTIECDLPGKYQNKNLKGVLAAAQLLSTMGWKLTAPKVAKALAHVKKNTGLMGRWECIQDSPKVVLDVAHNAPGIIALLDQLAGIHYNHLHIVTGMVRDKDIDAVLNLLPTEATYYYTQSHIPRALPANELAEKGNALQRIGKQYENVNMAIATANKNANPQDLILVIGSVFLVAEVDRSFTNPFDLSTL